MVVGSPAMMRDLGKQLVAAADESTTVAERWPKEIARPRVVGPYSDVCDYRFSFHLIGSAPLSEVAPIRHRNLHPIVFLAIGACTVVGAIAIWRWFFA